MKPKLTPWFPADIKPVRVGEYQCKDSAYPTWLWDGKRWRCPEHGFVCFIQDRVWRGLAKDPAKAAP